MTNIGTEQVGVARVTIYVTSAGKFSAELNDATYTDDTKAGLIEKLKRAVKAVENEKAIPVTFLDLTKGTRPFGDGGPELKNGRGAVHAKLRGAHARERGKYLFVTEDGKTKFSHSGWNREGKLCRRLTDDELAEYSRLVFKLDEAQRNYEAWLEGKQVSAGDLLGGD